MGYTISGLPLCGWIASMPGRAVAAWRPRGGLTVMRSRTGRPAFDDPGLHREIMQLRQVDDYTNLFYLALEYGSLALVVATAVCFAELRGQWGLAWRWNIPVFATAIVLVGAIQHRLAGLGHEASHYSFMKNRVLNDLVPD